MMCLKRQLLREHLPLRLSRHTSSEGGGGAPVCGGLYPRPLRALAVVVAKACCPEDFFIFEVEPAMLGDRARFFSRPTTTFQVGEGVAIKMVFLA